MAAKKDVIANKAVYQINQNEDEPTIKLEYEFSVKNNSKFNIDSFSKQSCILDEDGLLRGYDICVNGAYASESLYMCPEGGVKPGCQVESILNQMHIDNGLAPNLLAGRKAKVHARIMLNTTRKIVFAEIAGKDLISAPVKTGMSVIEDGIQVLPIEIALRNGYEKDEVSISLQSGIHNTGDQLVTGWQVQLELLNEKGKAFQESWTRRGYQRSVAPNEFGFDSLGTDNFKKAKLKPATFRLTLTCAICVQIDTFEISLEEGKTRM